MLLFTYKPSICAAPWIGSLRVVVLKFVYKPGQQTNVGACAAHQKLTCSSRLYSAVKTEHVTHPGNGQCRRACRAANESDVADQTRHDVRVAQRLCCYLWQTDVWSVQQHGVGSTGTAQGPWSINHATTRIIHTCQAAYLP